jgi:protein O-GlcNAc transferase
MIRWPFRREAAAQAANLKPPSVEPAEPIGRDNPTSFAQLATWLARGRAEMQGRNFSAAIATWNRLLAFDPMNLEARYGLANAHLGAGRPADAMVACQEALARLPGQADLLMLAGTIAAHMQQHQSALAYLESARSFNPRLVAIDERIGDRLAILGRASESVAAYDRALAAQPANLDLASRRLLVLSRADSIDRSQLAAERRRWGEQLEAAQLAFRRPHFNDRDPERRLRVGYFIPGAPVDDVSKRLNMHLATSDASLYEAHAFVLSAWVDDDATRRLRDRFALWYRCHSMSDDELAGTVRGQRIDILVDLVGHASGHRLAVMAREPAPVQVGWCGDESATEIATIDGRRPENPDDQEDRFAGNPRRNGRDAETIESIAPGTRRTVLHRSLGHAHPTIEIGPSGPHASIDAAFRDMWRSYCRESPPPPPSGFTSLPHA